MAALPGAVVFAQSASLAKAGQNVAVISAGDPGCYGVLRGATGCYGVTKTPSDTP